MSGEIEAPDGFLAGKAAAIRRLAKTVVRDVIEIGGHLAEVKAVLGHGHWLPWLEKEFAWSERTARNFMRAHELAQSVAFADLESLDISALYVLAAPSTPKAVRDDVIVRAKAGEAPTLTDIRHAVRMTTGEALPERTVVYDYAHLHGGKPADPGRPLTGDDLANYLLEGVIKDIQWLENKHSHIAFVKDVLANARRAISSRLIPRPPGKGSGIRIVK